MSALTDPFRDLFRAANKTKRTKVEYVLKRRSQRDAVMHQKSH